MLMETVVRFAPAEHQMRVPFDESNGDGLNFLAGKTMDFINRQEMCIRDRRAHAVYAVVRRRVQLHHVQKPAALDAKAARAAVAGRCV